MCWGSEGEDAHALQARFPSLPACSLSAEAPRSDISTASGCAAAPPPLPLLLAPPARPKGCSCWGGCCVVAAGGLAGGAGEYAEAGPDGRLGGPVGSSGVRTLMSFGVRTHQRVHHALRMPTRQQRGVHCTAPSPPHTCLQAGCALSSSICPCGPSKRACLRSPS